MDQYEKHRLDIKNILRGLTKFYSQKIDDELLYAYAGKLLNYDLNVIIKAVDEISSTASGKFPSLAEFKSIAANYSDTKTKLNDQHNKNYEDEQEKFKVIKQFIDSQIKNEHMDIFRKKYYQVFFNSESFPKELADTGITLGNFEICMYFDLYLSKLNSQNALKLCKHHIHEPDKVRKIYYWH